MTNIKRRLNKAEKALNFSEKPQIVTIVQFGGELPTDRTEGKITYHFVMFEDVIGQ